MYGRFGFLSSLLMWFSCSSRGSFWSLCEIFDSLCLSPFPCVFAWGIHIWARGDSFPGDLPPQTQRIGSDFGGFGWTRDFVFLVLDPRILLIEEVLGLDLRARGCPWGIPTIPKVSLQSTEPVGRSVELIFELTSGLQFFLSFLHVSGSSGLLNPDHPDFRRVSGASGFLNPDHPRCLCAVLFSVDFCSIRLLFVPLLSPCS